MLKELYIQNLAVIERQAFRFLSILMCLPAKRVPENPS